ncbi:MAG: type secretion system protein VirB6 [Sphingomonadales bacterium]|jgi:type IV secretion system protein VirB6|nr:type secretion system protein VirB6 [Sphingomonadales bacterium]
MAACPSIPPDEGFLRGVLDFVDCQAQSIGAEGYRALSAPGSTLSLVLLGFLTLFVALFGYRMLLGHVPGVRDGVLALVKIGIVLALATGWTAYRTLIYDVAFHGPAELAAEIGQPAGLPGAGGALVARLDYADRAMLELSALGPGDVTAAIRMTPSAEPGQPALPNAIGRITLGNDWLALDRARMTFLTGAIASLAAVRLIAGLMLALGPFFIAFLLFDGTRGLFEGWLRVLAGAAMGALGSGILLGVELAMLEPWLADLIARRTAGLGLPGVAVELYAVTLVFALALLAMLIATARVAYGFRLPPAWREAPASAAAAIRGDQVRIGSTIRETLPAAADRSRAAIVADAVASTQRREAGPAYAGGLTAVPASSGAASHVARHMTVHDRAAPPPAPRLGQSYRRTSGRVSASSGRRDRA